MNGHGAEAHPLQDEQIARHGNAGKVSCSEARQMATTNAMSGLVPRWAPLTVQFDANSSNSTQGVRRAIGVHFWQLTDDPTTGDRVGQLSGPRSSKHFCELLPSTNNRTLYTICASP